MCSKLSRTLSYAALILITVVSFSMAAPPGTVVSVDKQGVATVHTDDGKRYRVKVSGVKIGDKVDCTVKAGKTSCKKAS
ncbi:hypothetical protein C2W62_26260 [Candidatus Entotheonella serta]|nr:hypothetical protein C2W62_26260 [Candidatus Entotheonella serta]